MLSELTKRATTLVEVNEEFNRADVHFRDGSTLRFEHRSRKDRSAQASQSETTADRSCRALRQFRLNRKHLQLFFVDGSDAEYMMEAVEISNGKSVG
jgi:hypothetical protein